MVYERSDPGRVNGREPLPFSMQRWQRLFWAALYAIAMGVLEAVCVVYLRRLIDPAGSDLSNAAAVIGRTVIEPVRELCTLVMLLAVAWLAGTRWRSRLAYFFLMFGIWDILYYLGLYGFAGWPASLLEWDCLFLIPKPWFGPVLAPVLISAYFIFACTLVLAREYSGLPLRLTWPVLLLHGLGFALWYASFVRDSTHILAQGYSGVHYSWLLLAAGMLLCLVGVGLALLSGRRAGRKRTS
ncbi:MAG TPA: hypothetical protein PLG50_01905 [bacterium]|nr:hypothetical protein [bacterium]HQG44398.1 hypothetical protein [bacterium]HQI47376.1 hypothetical protein [bacterium]HQJ63022.1 hypothetical protein [bacterium]